MNTKTKTGRDDQQADSEFIWDIKRHTESHQFMTEPVLQILQKSGAKRVLDIDCENGALTQNMKQSGISIAGLDSSASGIEMARSMILNGTKSK